MTAARWNRQRLEELMAEEAEARSGAPEVVKALLAYARWKGLTEEAGIDRAAAKADVNRLLDGLDDNPQSWGAMKELVGRWNDAVLKDMLRYSVDRSQERLHGPALDDVPWLTKFPTPPEPPAETPKTQKRGLRWFKKDRSR